MMKNKNVSSTQNTQRLDNKLITEEFKKLEDNNSKKIKVDGMEKIGVILGIDIYSDIFITYFLYKCQCKVYGEITQEEFIRGLTHFNANRVSEIKNLVVEVKGELLNIFTEDFKKFYYFLFSFNLEKKNNKVLNFEVYKFLLEELFGSQFKIISEFLEFMETEKKSAQLKEDQWNIFLELLKVIGDAFPNGYNVEESWPTLFDEFFYWYCKKHCIVIERPEYE